MLTEKEKLEEELKLLEESLSLDVITKQEYEDAKHRIESKLERLKDLGQKLSEPKENPGVQEEDELKEDKEELKPKAAKESEKPKITEIGGGEATPFKEEEEVMYGVPEEYLPIDEDQKKLEDVDEAEEPHEEENKEDLESVPKPGNDHQEIVFEEGKKSSKKIFAYLAIVLILGFGSWYFFYSAGSNDSHAPSDIIDNPISLIACNSDDECAKEGSIGICYDPGTENAECEYIEDIKVKLMVLNSNSCFNCDSGRVLSILNSFFPNIETENIDFETKGGKEIAGKYSIIALPAYILNASLPETNNYYKFYNAFNKVSNSYVMKNTVANANYYIKREEIPNKLDLFLKQGQAASLTAEENLKEFLEAFDGKVDFKKHNEDSGIVKELGINTFPAFLINNEIKFSGVQSADKIRENFCQVNSVAECALGLTTSLV